MLKSEKVSKYFVQDCLKYSFLVFTSLKRPWNPKNDQLLEGKRKISSGILLCCNRTAFSLKFLLDAKVQNSAFRKISHSGIFCNWVASNINLKSQCDFPNTKIFAKCKIKKCGPTYKKDFVSSNNLWQRFGDKLMKSSMIDFLGRIFYSWSFVIFYQKTSKLGF